LLEEAGVTTLSLDMKNVREFGTDAPNLIRSFLEPIGIDVKFVTRDFPVYMEEVLGGNPSYQFTYFSGPQPIDSWRCPGWFLETCDPRVDDLLDKADAASSREEYESLRKQALLQHAKDAYLIPIDSWNFPYATDAAIAGIQPTVVPMNAFDLRGVHWTKG
jgi:peptide/nickel transport system substrate-binding protein